MGVYNATIITTAGQNLIADAIAGGEAVNFSSVKTSTHVYPAGTSLQNLTALDDVKQSVAPTSVDVYNNNVVQISARVPNTGISTAYLINTIGLFGQVSGGTETLIAVLTASTPDEVPEFDPESPAAFIFNVQMTIQNANEVTFEVNDSGTATVADINRLSNAIDLLDSTVVKKEPGLYGGSMYYGDNTDSSKFFGAQFTTGTGADDVYRVQFSQGGHFGVYKKNGSSWEQAPVYALKNAISNITRNGTTFTATRLDGTTFTFDQQDNNTWNANSTTVAGYVAAPTASKARYFYATGNDGSPAWRNNIYATGATASANGAAGLVPPPSSANYANRGLMFLRSDVGWQYLPLANNATTTAEHYALDARMGKTLNDAINAKIRFKTGSGTISSVAANSTTGVTINNMGITGYTLQGIVYINKTGTNADHVVLTRFFTSDSANNCSLYFKNTLGSAVSNLTVTVNCIYIKN